MKSDWNKNFVILVIFSVIFFSGFFVWLMHSAKNLTVDNEISGHEHIVVSLTDINYNTLRLVAALQNWHLDSDPREISKPYLVLEAQINELSSRTSDLNLSADYRKTVRSYESILNEIVLYANNPNFLTAKSVTDICDRLIALTEINRSVLNDARVSFTKEIHKRDDVIQQKSREFIIAGLVLIAFAICCLFVLSLYILRTRSVINTYELSAGKSRAKLVELELLRRKQSVLLLNLTKALLIRLSERTKKSIDLSLNVLLDIQALSFNDLNEFPRTSSTFVVGNIIKTWSDFLDLHKVDLECDVDDIISIQSDPTAFRDFLRGIGRIAQVRSSVTDVNDIKRKIDIRVSAVQRGEKCLFIRCELPKEVMTRHERVDRYFQRSDYSFDEPLVGALIEATTAHAEHAGGISKIEYIEDASFLCAQFHIDINVNAAIKDIQVEDSHLHEASPLVLLFEPNENVRAKIKKYLELDGFGVSSVGSVADIEHTLEVSPQFNGAIIDMQSDGSGLELAQMIVDRANQQVPVWVVVSTDEEQGKAISKGFMTIKKPIKSHGFQPVVKEVRRHHNERISALLTSSRFVVE